MTRFQLKRKARLGACVAAGLAVQISAHAQSSVTMYGILSEGIAYISNEAGKSNVVMDTGTQLNNRWGLRGVEDIGGGLKAIFTLENGFDLGTGKLQQGGRMFGRQAFVGLSSAQWGTITLGRQYDAGVDYLVEFTAMGAGMGKAANIGDNDNLLGSIRFNNSVKYRSPTFYGAQGEVMYAMSNASQFAYNRMWSAGLSYQNGNLSLGAAFFDLDNPGTVGNTNANGAATDDYVGAPFVLFHTSPLSANVGVARQRMMATGGRYKLDKLTLAALVSDVRYTYLDNTSLHLTNYDATVAYFLTPALQLSGSYVYTRGKYGGYDHSPHWNMEQVSIDYFFSKRTDIALFADYGQAHDAQVVFYSLVPASKNGNQLYIAAGIRHRF